MSQSNEIDNNDEEQKITRKDLIEYARQELEFSEEKIKKIEESLGEKQYFTPQELEELANFLEALEVDETQTQEQVFETSNSDFSTMKNQRLTSELKKGYNSPMKQLSQNFTHILKKKDSITETKRKQFDTEQELNELNIKFEKNLKQQKQIEAELKKKKEELHKKNEELEETKNELKKLQESLNQEKKILEKELKQKEQEIEEKKKEIESLIEKIAENKETSDREKISLKNQLQETQKKVENLMKQLEEDKKIIELQKKEKTEIENSIKIQISKHKEEIKTKLDIIDSKQMEIEELLLLIKEQSEKPRLSNPSNHGEKEKIMQKSTSITDELNESKNITEPKEKENLINSNNKMQEDLRTEKNRVTEFKKIIDEKEQKIKEIENERDQFKRVEKETEKKLQEINRNEVLLKQELNEAKKKIFDLEKLQTSKRAQEVGKNQKSVLTSKQNGQQEGLILVNKIQEDLKTENKVTELQKIVDEKDKKIKKIENERDELKRVEKKFQEAQRKFQEAEILVSEKNQMDTLAKISVSKHMEIGLIEPSQSFSSAVSNSYVWLILLAQMFIFFTIVLKFIEEML